MHTIFILLIGLQLKHFVADYLLQTSWMIAGKRNLFALGGYAHAGIHVIGTMIVLVPLGIPLNMALAIIIAEFIIHFGLDYAKARYGDGTSSEDNPKVFWAKHGLDQLLHHLTYIGIAYVVFGLS